jgi:RNA polymerase sigma-70 factor (ECF subfamily)
MPETLDLATPFLMHVRGRLVPPSDLAGLNRALTLVLERAHARWPDVRLPPELFMKHLAERLPDPKAEGPLEVLLSQWCVEDLYLACACLHQVPLAAKTFEQHYLRKLPKLLGHRERSVGDVDEICQQTGVKLLVASVEGPPKIAEYRGTGDLQNWMVVIASRIASRMKTPSGRVVALADDDIETPMVDLPEDPTLRFIKRHHQDDLRQAFRETFASLSDENRYWLRLYYVDRLTMYEMADLLRTSQPTVSRGMEKIRETISTGIRRSLQARLGLSSQEFESFINIVDSKFDVHLSRLLGGAAEPKRPPSRD